MKLECLDICLVEGRIHRSLGGLPDNETQEEVSNTEKGTLLYQYAFHLQSYAE